MKLYKISSASEFSC